jgi:hypothetical protein
MDLVVRIFDVCQQDKDKDDLSTHFQCFLDGSGKTILEVLHGYHVSIVRPYHFDTDGTSQINQGRQKESPPGLCREIDQEFNIKYANAAIPKKAGTTHEK